MNVVRMVSAKWIAYFQQLVTVESGLQINNGTLSSVCAHTGTGARGMTLPGQSAKHVRSFRSGEVGIFQGISCERKTKPGSTPIIERYEKPTRQISCQRSLSHRRSRIKV
ncbi:MAG: hypothetical protein GY903_01235 [Fuerstiella sp.]|nr:hypothetical protein [Fuerstiella sp.]